MALYNKLILPLSIINKREEEKQWFVQDLFGICGNLYFSEKLVKKGQMHTKVIIGNMMSSLFIENPLKHLIMGQDLLWGTLYGKKK